MKNIFLKVLFCLIVHNVLSLGAYSMENSGGIIYSRDEEFDSMNALVNVRETKSGSNNSGFIKSYYAWGGETENDLIPSNVTMNEASLADVNSRSDVKVYILLIKGQYLPDRSIPDGIQGVSAVFDKIKNGNISTVNAEDLKSEAKKITEQLSAKEAALHNGPMVFCSIVEYVVKDNSGKAKVSLYHHSLSYNFEDGEAYLSILKAKVNKATWNGIAESNLFELVSSIRQASQEYSSGKVNAVALAALEAELMKIETRPEMENRISSLNKEIKNGTFNKDVFFNFDNILRAHVAYYLLTSADGIKIDPKKTQTYNPGYSFPSTDGGYDGHNNLFLVLESVKDEDLVNWLNYINTNNIKGKSLLGHLVENLDDKIFGEDEYKRLIKIINKQVKYDPQFLSKKVQDLLSREHEGLQHTIVWPETKLGYTTVDINVSLTDNGKIRLSMTQISTGPANVSITGVPLTDNTRSQTTFTPLIRPVEFDPFDLVSFINESELSLLSDITPNNKQVVFVPAIYLLYASDKRLNATFLKTASATFDIVTLPLPLTKLTYGPKIFRYIVYGADLATRVNTISNLAIETNLASDEYKDLVKKHMAVKQIIDLGPYALISVDAAQGLAGFVRAVYRNKEALAKISSQNAEADYFLKVAEKIDANVSKTKGKNWVDETLGPDNTNGPNAGTGSNLGGTVAKADYYKNFNSETRTLYLSDAEADNILGLTPQTKLVRQIEDVDNVVINGNQYALRDGRVTVKIYEVDGAIKAVVEGFCFDGETPVVLGDGKFKPIKNIKVGDAVMSFDHKLNTSTKSKVTALFKKTTDSIAKVFVKGAVILATLNHPFYTPQGYAEISSLHAGDSIYNLSGKFEPIDSILVKDSILTVFNFEVEGHHNYFVSPHKVLVHNQCRLLDIRKIAEASKKPQLYQDFYKSLDEQNIWDGTRASLAKKIFGLGEEKTIAFLEDFAKDGPALKAFTNNNNLPANSIVDINKELELIDVWQKWESKGIKGIEELKAFKKVWYKNVRNVSFDDFYEKTKHQIKAVYIKNLPGNKKFAAELFEAWEAKDVKQLEDIYIKYGLSITKDYPPCEGVWGIDVIRNPRVDENFDRFQTEANIKGSYASPVDANQFTPTLDMRSLKEDYASLTNLQDLNGPVYYYVKFKFKDPKDVVLEFGEAMPWFGKPGGAMQIKSRMKFDEMLHNIEILEQAHYHNGKWEIK